MEVETNQKIGAQAYAFPANEHQHVVVRENQREHGEHEKVEVSEKSVVSAFMRHVADRINVEQQPDARERIEEKSGVGLKRSGRSIGFQEVGVPSVGTEPGVKNFFVRLVIVCRSPIRILHDGTAGHEE